MRLRDFHNHRRQELVKFFEWRYGTPHWVTPFAFTTGLPRYIAQLLKSGKGLSVQMLERAEDRAIFLGFRPTYPSLVGYQFLKPPPTNLPKWTDPGIRLRFKTWVRENPYNSRDRKPKKSHVERKAKVGQNDSHECHSVSLEPSQSITNCITSPAITSPTP